MLYLQDQNFIKLPSAHHLQFDKSKDRDIIICMSDLGSNSEPFLSERIMSPHALTRLALGAAALEIAGAVVEYANTGKVDGTFIALGAITAIVGGTSAWLGRLESNMGRLREASTNLSEGVSDIRTSARSLRGLDEQQPVDVE